jgi:Tol biopolymer transport system component
MLSSSVAHAQAAPDLRGALPAEGAVEQVVLVEPGARTLFLNRGGDLIVYDHASRASTRLAERVWDVSVSARRDLVAYVKGGEARTDHFIWLLPVDPRTGLATGSERRLSPLLGDAPAISPDGRFVAFARDDSTGVGQSLLVVPVGGGKERTLVAGMPSSIRAISWTPDGKSIYFGVNVPVPCVPEWSCLPLGDDRQRWGSIRRVAVEGNGNATVVVARARSVFPGLSPDGSTIVYGAVDGTRRWIVANPDGSERASLTLPPSQVIQGWSGTMLLVGERQMNRGLRGLSTIEYRR